MSQITPEIGGLFEVVETKDGSRTLLNKELDEHYHSIHGAYQESMHVFIDMGLRYLDQIDKIKLLEIGFGTGLNAVLSLIHQKEGANIYYTGLELYPLKELLVKSLGYDKLIDAEFKDDFEEMHKCEWERDCIINDDFILRKVQCSIHEIEFSDYYDLVYFDAFAPRPQPDMWGQDVFEKLYNAMNKGSVLVTYCSKGDVRRAMQAEGFEVEKLPGPTGKREMLRATK